MRQLTFSALLLILQVNLFGQKPNNYRYSVLYTGRLFGYARTPDIQNLNGPQNSAPSDVATAYLHLFDSHPNKDPWLELRLAMGDNLAPDFEARTVQVNEPPSGPVCGRKWAFPASMRIPKDLFYYQDEERHRGWWLYCQDELKENPFLGAQFSDNAAAFLIEAHYDATVPGKHDFFLGAEYLRQVGTFLDHRGVRMLGSNIVVSTSRASNQLNVSPRIPERLADPCHTDTGLHPCYRADFRQASVDLPDDVLPFKQQFAIKNARRVMNPLTSDPYRSDEVVGKQLTAERVRYDNLIDITRTEICVEGGNQTRADPSMVLHDPTGCRLLRPAEEACKAGISGALASTCKTIYSGTEGLYDNTKQKASADVTFLLEQPGGLTPGKNHLLCTYLHANPQQLTSPWDKYPTCKPFEVQVPFFWSGKLAQPDAQPQPEAFCDLKNPVPCPFALVKGGSEIVAVFGIVDPDLLSKVGLLNRSWLNRRHSWDTSTKVISPEYALKQTLELCNSIEKCRLAPKVLMAQMWSARAAQLIANFADTFDLVISQSEKEHQSGTRTLEISDDRPQFVVTPTVPFNPDPKTPNSPDSASAQTKEQKSGSSEIKTPVIEPVIYRAVITKDTTSQRNAAVCWKLTNTSLTEKSVQVHPVSRICEGSELYTNCKNLERASRLLLADKHSADDITPLPATALGASYHLKQVTLLSIRDHLKTDIAMLQERDFFDVDRLGYAQLEPGDLQNQLGLILWKEDFAVRLHLTGATLKKLLKQSGKFSELDHDVLASEIERQRGLTYVGIYQDPKDSNSYFVNGAPLVESKLYTVAASSFLASGDTGYSDLAAPDVLPNNRVEDFEHQYLIAGLVCRDLARYAVRGDGIADDCLNKKFGQDYFDISQALPFDATGGYDTTQHYRTFWRNFIPRPPAHKQSEESVQERPFWSLNLENLDFTYNGVYINHIRSTTSSLAGVSLPGIAQSSSNSVGSDHKLRFVEDLRWGAFYLLSDSSFLRNSTGTATVPSVVNNMLGSEAGGTIRIPAHRPSWLSAQYSVRYEREIAQPPPTQLKKPSLLLPTPQISTIYGRLGLRAELGDTYLEMGAEEIDSRGVLQQSVFTTPGAPMSYCQPASSGFLCGPDSSPNSLLNNKPISSPSFSGLSSAAVSSVTTAYLNGGAYFNFSWKFPIWSRQDALGTNQSWYFVLTNKGDIYFNSHTDTPVQTRYLDKLTPSLVFPIWGKLSFSPKVDLILYENKVNRFHYRALQPGFSVSYSFIRREGLKWAPSLAYGAQTTAQPTPAGH